MMIKCPADNCDFKLEEEDYFNQRIHLETEHPEIIAQRLAELHKFDGWEDD